MKKTILMIAITTISIMQNLFAQSDSSQFSAVIDSYLSVKDALIENNGDSVQTKAKELFNAIDKIQMDQLSSSDRKAWLNFNEKLSYDAEHIKGTDDIELQRDHFSKLSINLYKLIADLKINTKNLYYQFCPMANDGKGAYWLSENEKIRNPYFGKRMLTCGSTRETLKANQQ